MLQNDAALLVLDELLLRYPGIRSEYAEEGGLQLSGVIKLEKDWYTVHIYCPHFPHLQQMRLQLKHFHEVKLFTETSASFQPEWTTVSNVFENLPTLLSKAPQKPEPVVSFTKYNIYAEITALYAPKLYQIELNNDLASFIRFAQFEQHYLELELPSLRVHRHSLPDCACANWPEVLQKCTLSAIVEQFQKYLEDLRPFYESFNHIDELCHVVQPSTPTTKDNLRVFVLSKRVFLKLFIADPFEPLASMSVQIIGPTYKIEPLRSTFSEGWANWDTELDIHSNLLRIFDLCFFPMPPASGNHSSVPTPLENTTEEHCNICYCYELSRGEIPLISCDNPKCKFIFHAWCLKEWFSRLTDGKVFLDVTFGRCPACKTKLSASFAELLEI